MLGIFKRHKFGREGSLPLLGFDVLWFKEDATGLFPLELDAMDGEAKLDYIGEVYGGEGVSFIDTDERA